MITLVVLAVCVGVGVVIGRSLPAFVARVGMAISQAKGRAKDGSFRTGDLEGFLEQAEDIDRAASSSGGGKRPADVVDADNNGLPDDSPLNDVFPPTQYATDTNGDGKVGRGEWLTQALGSVVGAYSDAAEKRDQVIGAAETDATQAGDLADRLNAKLKRRKK